jgi:hypothetical protein
MKTSSIIAWVLVAIVIIGIIIWVATSEDAQETTDKTREDDERFNFVKRVTDRIEKIQREVDYELRELQRTVEMQEFVNRKMNRFILFIRVTVGLILASIFGILTYNGMDVWPAVLSTTGIICLAVPVLTYFFFTQVMDVKELMNWLTQKIKEAVYKKYGCDPSIIEGIEKSIAIKKGVWNGLQDELKSKNVE